MKHTRNRSNSTVKSKTKTLAQNRAVAKTKPTVKKSVGEAELKSRQKLPVQKAKSVTVKVAPKISARMMKSTVTKTAPKIAAKNSSEPKSVRERKPKNNAGQIGKLTAKKIALKMSDKTIKAPVKKTKTLVSAEKAAVGKKLKIEQKTNKHEVIQQVKPKTAAQKSKISVKASAKPVAKTSAKTAKQQLPKVEVRTAKARRPKVEIAVQTKIKSVVKKAKSADAPVKSKLTQKTNLIVASKKPKNNGKPKLVATKTVERKTTAPVISAKKDNQKSKKSHSAVTAKKVVKEKVVKKPENVKSIAAKKKVSEKIQKPKLTVSTAKLKKQSLKIKKPVAVEKIKAKKDAVETIEPRPQKPKNRKARPISSAVFRGKKERYDFKVFELNEKFEPIPAVYIISKRKTDRNKKGHHALVCIGETASISDELKRHRKGKCVKKHQANVVSILPETDEKTRLKIETDLKAAHSVACNFD